MGILASIFGFFGLALIPLGSEMVAQLFRRNDKVVDEGTTAGMLVVGGQIQGLILLLIMQTASVDLSIDDAPIK